MENKLKGFRFWKEMSATKEYVHFYLVIMFDSNSFYNDHFTITWQANKGESDWYAPNIEAKGTTSEYFNKISKLIDKINLNSPEAAVESLKQLKFKQVEYHKGQCGFYAVDKFPKGSTFAVRITNIGIIDNFTGTQNKAEEYLKKLAIEDISKEKRVGFWENWLKNPILEVTEREQFLKTIDFSTNIEI